MKLERIGRDRYRLGENNAILDASGQIGKQKDAIRDASGEIGRTKDAIRDASGEIGRKTRERSGEIN